MFGDRSDLDPVAGDLLSWIHRKLYASIPDPGVTGIYR